MVAKTLSNLRTPARLGLIVAAFFVTLLWNPLSRFRHDHLGFLLIPAILLLLATLPWTVESAKRIVFRSGGASDDSGALAKRRDRLTAWTVGALLLFGFGVACTVMLSHYMKRQTEYTSSSTFVVVSCFALSLWMPLNAAFSNRLRSYRVVHVGAAIGLSLIYLLFIVFLYGTVYGGDRWERCQHWALAMQFLTLTYCGFRLLTDDQLGSRTAGALSARFFGSTAGSSSNTSEDATGQSRANRGASILLKIVSVHKWGPALLALHREPGDSQQVLRTAWIVLSLGMILNLILQITLSIAVVMMLGPPQFSLEVFQSQSQELLTNPTVFMGILVVSQMAFLVVALVAAKLSPTPTLERLALRPLDWKFRRWLLLLAACLFPVAIGVILTEFLSMWLTPDPTLELVLRRLSGSDWLLYLLSISLLPGFAEELLFRGYFQSRLHRRWHPGWCVTLSGVLFGLFHIQPHAILFATVVGLWLAYVAFRSGSTWSAIACHVSINAGMTLTSLGALRLGIEGGITLWTIFASIGLIPFVITLRWLRSTPQAKQAWQNRNAN